MNLIQAAEALAGDLKPLRFGPPVTHVYSPLEYAARSHRLYLKKYARKSCQAVLLGMNPGPWGMAQTGVPFGEVSLVRDWLGIECPVGKPEVENPKRPIEGFACQRSEVSGRRVWGWAKDVFKTPDRFFSQFFIANYCPLCFMEESGRNRTPDKLPKAESAALYDACDLHLRRLVKYLSPRIVIGVGAFAEKRARAALDGMDVEIGRILHPSPASPLANRGWAGKATAELAALGVAIPPQ
jgi:single-strand selective monofunctional uracil DNA glycosylase